MQQINIYGLTGAVLIILDNAGPLYSNQVGGTACLHPSTRGFLIPIENHVVGENNSLVGLESNLLAHFTGSKYGGNGAVTGLDDEDGDIIDNILTTYCLEMVRVNRLNLANSCEAWVYVDITDDERSDSEMALWHGFSPYPRKGILTWRNSD